ncbi:MAG: hypothetical protein ACRDN9_07240, partial [Streptosporangiaceae bacterium]
MARLVFLHIGAPKSGTTFLQDVLWRNRQRLADQGILLPCQRRDHLHATLVIREDPHIDRRLPSAPGAWDRIVDQTNSWPGTVIISHEFFGAATPEQAKRAIDDLAPAEVHIVFTSRDYVRQIPGAWQERLKYRFTDRFSDFIADDSEGGPLTEMGWRTYDASGVLGRWAIDVPPERVHVVTVPQEGGSPGVLWKRFATLCGIDPDSCDTSTASPNRSLSVAQAELLRRVNFKIAPPIRGPRELAGWIRDFLAHRILAAQGGDRLGLPPDMIPALRARARRAVDEISATGYDVVGDLAELIPPEGLPERPHPDAVTDAELLEVATQAIADMLHEYRAQTLRANGQQRRADEAAR